MQGLESENTCNFLLALAQCASNPRVDSVSAVSRCLKGEQPGQGPAALKGGSIEPAQAKSDSFSNESQAKMPA